MRLKGIKERLRKSDGYKALENLEKNKKYPIGVYGIGDSSRAFLIATFFEEHDEDVYIVSHSEKEARSIFEDLLLYELDVYYLPGKTISYYNLDAISDDLKWERLKTMKDIVSDKKKIIVTVADSLNQRYMPKNLYNKYSFTLKVGEVLDLSKLGERLIEAGYKRSEVCENKGEFALRGGIVDIFPPGDQFPFRVELFGDEIETIRTFNQQTQRSIDLQDEAQVFPNAEIIVEKDAIEKAIEKMKEDLESVIKNKEKRQALGEEALDRLSQIVHSNIEKLQETWTFETIDSYLTYFYEKSETLFDYMENAFVFIDDTQRTLGRVESLEFEYREQFENLYKRGNVLTSQANVVVSFNEVLDHLNSRKTLSINDLAKTEKYLPPKGIVSFMENTIYNYHGQLDMLVDDVKRKRDEGYSTLILSGSRSRGERLVDLLKERGIVSKYRDDLTDVSEGKVGITFGNSKKGFEFTDIKLAIISDSEVFGDVRKKATQRKIKKGKGIEKIKSFDELRKGEYVVHITSGIGIFKGIKQIKTQGALKDYLEIEYAKGDKLFVPVDQLDMVQKYIGSEGEKPKVSEMSGREWQKARAKAKESVDKVAKEIVELYAKRSQVKGFEFSPDSDMQKNFEEDFPYEPTQDQIASIEEIKKDMESPYAMDRLLCGDVGYGKTEVAMRAAFKAVLDGKQVAVLVPTTILAEQHYKNFIRRFESFAVNIEMINRFRTPKQVKESLAKLKQGNVDIIIGTHKLLGKGVVFKDLGLLIIDEEQRFGVKQKEKIKEMQTNVDVLTLSATPIPRTLNMSMTGVRDISLIETPPENRLPVQTYVIEYNEQIIRDAIIRELNRKGQVYFLYNHVEDIDNMKGKLAKLVPEATFEVAHGQLPERKLEDVMIKFYEGEADVLVCSTIIETGLDIPNVNTLIVYDSDKMGLSQLYQLRGRVGRSNRIAYAYLTYKKDKVLTEVAEKRLRALKDFTELGSGFKIAMKDLEIRGAGNMMGKAQHGQMAAVGYDLYIRLLDEAVKKLMGGSQVELRETLVDIKIDAYIPSSYIKDEVLKIQIYKKIAALENHDDYMSVKAELEDRFSDIPDSVYNLMDISLLRAKANQLGISELRERGNDVHIIFYDSKDILDGFVGLILNSYKDRIQIGKREKPSLIFKYVGQDKSRVISRLSKLMNDFLNIKYPKDDKQEGKK